MNDDEYRITKKTIDDSTQNTPFEMTRFESLSLGKLLSRYKHLRARVRTIRIVFPCLTVGGPSLTVYVVSRVDNRSQP